MNQGGDASSGAAERELQAFKAGYERRVAARDAAGLAELYAENAVRLPPAAPALAGREAIRAAWEETLAGVAAIADQGHSRFTIGRRRAHEVGTYRITGRRRDGTGFAERGRYITTFVRAGGRWWITAEIWRVARRLR